MSLMKSTNLPVCLSVESTFSYVLQAADQFVVVLLTMGPVPMRHRLVVDPNLPPSPVISWIELGGKPK